VAVFGIAKITLSNLTLKGSVYMTNVTYDEIFGTALTLPPLYRAMLVEHLLNSLDEVNSEVQEAWGVEIKNRIQAIDGGKVALIPSEEVLQGLKNR
jgi:putative addiction module component (TIGR02574 family)